MPELGKDISLETIVKQILRVVEFDRNGTVIKPDGSVKANGWFKPYGYLKVTSPILKEKSSLRIIHRDDFLLADSIFNDPKLANYVDSDELLVCYSPKVLVKDGFSGSPHHVLHFLLAPSGTIESYYLKDNGIDKVFPEPEKLMGPFIYGPGEDIRVNFFGTNV